MRFHICYLKPKGPIHLGEKEGNLEGSLTFIHSDTLFSAFCSAFHLLYGKDELEKLLKNFEDKKPDFLISSAFPYWGNRLFFPILLHQTFVKKGVKKVQFIEKDGFEELLIGEREGDWQTIPTDKEPYYPWELENIPRVALGRLDNHPGENFFHFGQTTYRDDAGLFFIIRYQNENFQTKFEAAMRLLADEGIGGDRSSGKGLMEKPIFQEIELNVPEEGDGIITLSLYYPNEDEVSNLANGFYNLIERKGYIYSPYGSSLRRRSVRMFSEGSVFPKEPEKIGKLVSVTPNIFPHHQVYRYGYLFALPCKMGIKNED
ncbi:MAG: type III-A CRISPR-associated RAMP protein Csm4 [candidate division WOR-3 bacterium]